MWTVLKILIAHTALFAPTGQVSAKAERSAPRFEDFQVPAPSPARANKAFVANHVPGWRRSLGELAKEGPDFAGHFIIAQWTCGSTCTGFAIVDTQKGTVKFAPFDVAYAFCPDPFEPGSELEYRLNSRLLIVNGHVETGSSTNGVVDGPCGHFYYTWDGHSLKRISSVVSASVSKPPE